MYKVIIFDFFDVIRAGGGQLDGEVLKIIEQLSRSYKVGLLTNASSGYVRQVLSDQDIEKYFTAVVIAGEIGMVKPSLEIFDYTLRQLGVQPAEAIFVDDDPANVQGAEAAGIKSIVFEGAAQLGHDLSVLLKTIGP